jgi:hypothetical protein
MIGPGNVIKVKPLVDTIPATAIRVPVTINKIDTKMDLSFVETKNAAVDSTTAPKPKIIPLTIELSGNKLLDHSIDLIRHNAKNPYAVANAKLEHKSTSRRKSRK